MRHVLRCSWRHSCATCRHSFRHRTSGGCRDSLCFRSSGLMKARIPRRAVQPSATAETTLHVVGGRWRSWARPRAPGCAAISARYLLDLRRSRICRRQTPKLALSITRPLRRKRHQVGELRPTHEQQRLRASSGIAPSRAPRATRSYRHPEAAATVSFSLTR